MVVGYNQDYWAFRRSPASAVSSLRHPQNRITSNSTSRKIVDPLHEHWRTYTYLSVFVTGLPWPVTTLELYKNFASYGDISNIAIKETREGQFRDKAIITFK